MTWGKLNHPHHIRPEGEQNNTEILLSNENGIEVDEEVAYEGRFVEGASGSSASSGTIPNGKPVVEGEGVEGANIRMKRTPVAPSNIARAKHEDANHIPYRDWCTDCVAGRGVSDPHRSTKDKQESEDRENREVCMDYCFPGGVKSGGATVLAVRSRRCGSTLSLVMPSKGLPEQWVARRVAKAIDSMGHGNVLLTIKSDGENSIKLLRDAVAQIRRSMTNLGCMEESSSRGDSAGNGVAENACREIEGMIRTLQHMVERKTGKPMNPKCHAMTWLIEHVGQVISRCKVGTDGKTPYERVKGKSASALMLAWGERVLYMPSTTNKEEKKRSKGDYRYLFGVYLGINAESNDCWIGTETGKIVTARSIRRVTEEEKWRAEAIEGVRGLPWDLKCEKDEVADLEVEIPERAADVPEPPPEVPATANDPELRRVRINKEWIVRFGPTEKCPGCRDIMKGVRCSGHNEKCRERVEVLMRQTPEGSSQLDKGQARMTEAFIKRLEKTATETDEAEANRVKSVDPENQGKDPEVRGREEISRGETETEEREAKKARTEKSVKVTEGSTEEGGQDEDNEPKRRRLDHIGEKVEMPMVGPKVKHVFFDLTNPKRNKGREGESQDDPCVHGGDSWDLGKAIDMKNVMRKMIDHEPTAIICDVRAGGQKSRITYTAKGCGTAAMEQARHGRYFAVAVEEESKAENSQAIRSIKILPGTAEIEIRSKKWSGMIITNGIEIRKSLDKAKKKESSKSEVIMKEEIEEEQKYPKRRNNQPGPEGHYPGWVCKAIREGIRKQVNKDKDEVRMIASIMIEGGPLAEGQVEKWEKYHRKQGEDAEEMSRAMLAAIDGKWKQEDQFPDHVNGGYLDPVEVLKARAEEIGYIRKYGIYDKVYRENCRGKKIVKTRWVDTDKGAGTGVSNHRSRLVAMEFNRSPNAAYFSATPPLEAMKLIISHAASQGNHGKGSNGLLYVDVRRAYFNAPVKREVYVEIPSEDKSEEDGDVVGRLKASLYGTRDAAANWAEEYTKVLCSNGFVQGKATPCAFVHLERGIRTLVHGDDFLASGDCEELKWMEAQLGKVYEIKSGIISNHESHEKSMTVLGRAIRWTPNGIEYEPDGRHAREIVRCLGLENSKCIGTPADHSDDGDDEEEDSDVDGSQATAYRSIAARCNYLAMDRGDIQFATRQACKAMAGPKKRDWRRLKRIGRYLKGRLKWIQLFAWQEPQIIMSAFVDSDWAGDRVDRKSVSGGAVTVGAHMIRTWSKDQDIRALSSGEAELYAACTGGCQAKGIKSVASDLGLSLGIKMRIDASAAIGIIRRRGLGKVRHIDVKDLWLQDEVKEGRIEVEKIPGLDNPADMGTKGLARADIDKHVKFLKCYFEEESQTLYSAVLDDQLPTLCEGGLRDEEYLLSVGGCKTHPMLPQDDPKEARVVNGLKDVRCHFGSSDIPSCGGRGVGTKEKTIYHIVVTCLSW